MVSANNGKFRKDIIRSLTARLAIKMLVTALVVVNVIRGKRIIVVLLGNESKERIVHNASFPGKHRCPVACGAVHPRRNECCSFQLTVLCLLFVQSSLRHLFWFPCLMLLNIHVRLHPPLFKFPIIEVYWVISLVTTICHPTGPAEGEGLEGLEGLQPPHFFENYKELLRKKCFQPPPPHFESLVTPPPHFQSSSAGPVPIV